MKQKNLSSTERKNGGKIACIQHFRYSVALQHLPRLAAVHWYQATWRHRVSTAWWASRSHCTHGKASRQPPQPDTAACSSHSQRGTPARSRRRPPSHRGSRGGHRPRRGGEVARRQPLQGSRRQVRGRGRGKRGSGKRGRGGRVRSHGKGGRPEGCRRAAEGPRWGRWRAGPGGPRGSSRRLQGQDPSKTRVRCDSWRNQSHILPCINTRTGKWSSRY